jgi:carbamoylphosphate synthase large subunit
VIIRPSFTLGGSGGGIAYNKEEFVEICERGLEASPDQELLIEESLLGWKEYEMEVVRDRKPTTASSSARSRTSTRWACTPATRSPSRRRRR